MKLKYLAPVLAACGLTLGALPVIAQDNDTAKPPPPPRDGEKPADHPRDGNRTERGPRDGDNNKHGSRDGEHHERGGDHRGPQPEMKPTRFIGVLTRMLTPELSAQTGLAPGFGLLVEEVMPDTPAMKAGMQQHDVLVMLDDQKLVNQEQLATLVRSTKKDDDIVFTIKRAGAEMKVTVKVGEKLMADVSQDQRRGMFEPFRGMMDGMFNSQNRDRVNQMQQEMRERYERGTKEFGEHAKEFGERMRDFGEKMRDWSRGPKDHPAPVQPRYDDERRDGNRSDREPSSKADKNSANLPKGDAVVSSSSSSSFQRAVTRRDDSGDYSLRDDNGTKIFTSKLHGGEETTHVVNTEEQRNALPEELRAKLRELEKVNAPLPEDPTAPASPAPRKGI